MTSQSLYRKWRSQTFDDLIGQEAIVETLKNALITGNLSHAYLFTGPRGTGKTSTARLLAKTVNCENPREGEPCNECRQCREITQGNSLNVIEIDAASNRGIDNIRELRERVMVPPASGKYKVYVLDEAHMLTAEAFNALLKTLEEPPEYAIFVLATTDVHKMLPTVISRCQCFYFKRISTNQIVARLNYIAGQENVNLDQGAAKLLARAAAGGMRDALSLLDQAIAYAGDEISLGHVQSMLGVADPRAISKFVTCVADLDTSGVLHLIHELSEAGADLRQINSQVMEYWRALMLAKAGADTADILDLTEDEAREIQQVAQRFSLETLTECARIFAQNELVQKNQGTPQLGLELGALEAIEVHRRAQSSPVSLAAPQSARPAVAPASSSLSFDTQPRAAQSAAPSMQSQTSRSPSRQAEEDTMATPRQPEVSPAMQTDAAPAEQQGVSPILTVQQIVRVWDKIKMRTKQKSKSGMLAAYLAYYHVVGVEGTAEQPIVVIQAEKPLHFDYVKKENRYKDIEWALQMEFNLPCQVRLLPPDASYSPSQARDAASYSSAAATPQPSAYREPPTVSPPLMGAEQTPTQKSSSTQPLTSQVAMPSTSRSTPLAEKRVVRENKQEMPEETLEQKVRRDPVVQEVMRTFSAKIVDIQPK